MEIREKEEIQNQQQNLSNEFSIDIIPSEDDLKASKDKVKIYKFFKNSLSLGHCSPIRVCVGLNQHVKCMMSAHPDVTLAVDRFVKTL